MVFGIFMKQILRLSGDTARKSFLPKLPEHPEGLKSKSAVTACEELPCVSWVPFTSDAGQRVQLGINCCRKESALMQPVKGDLACSKAFGKQAGEHK